MNKTTTTTLLATLLLAGTAMGATRFWEGDSGNIDWETAANWNVPPIATDSVSFRGLTTPGQDARAQLSSPATVVTVFVGGVGSTSLQGVPTLTLQAGSALTLGAANIGYSVMADTSAALGILNIQAGTHTDAGDFNIGNAAQVNNLNPATGTVNINGGTLNVAGVSRLGAHTGGANSAATIGNLTINTGGLFNSSRIGVGLYLGDYGNGTLTLNGGNANFAGNVRVGQQGTSTGTIRLLAGNLDCPAVAFGLGTASIEIAQGYLTMDLDLTATITGWLAGNDVSAIGGMTDDSAFTSLYTSGFTSVAQGSYFVRYGYDSVNQTTALWSVVPEPSTLSLVAVFGGGLLFIRRLRK
jgi:hypothetical protein